MTRTALGTWCGLLALGGCSQAGRVPGFSTGTWPELTSASPTVGIDTIPGGRPRWSKVDVSGDVACGLLSNGIAACWGNAAWGQLDVPDERFTDLIAGDAFTCGQTETGSITCWGCENTEGDEEPTAPCTEMPAEPLTDLQAAYGEACGVSSGGDVVCWGMLSPFEEQDRWPGPFLSWAVGDANLCTIDLGGQTTCYGSLGTPPGRDEPLVAIQPPPEPLFQQVATTPNGGCGLQFDGMASCWGYNDRLPPGRGPAVQPPLVELRTISSGGWDICGLGVDGRAVCWGDGFMDPMLRSYDPPPAELVFDSVDNGDLHACGIVEGGEEIRCWGLNSDVEGLDPGPSIDDVMAAHGEPP
jgi:hypothetical protein